VWQEQGSPVSDATEHTPQDSQEPAAPRRVDRRTALRLLGLTAVAAAPIPFLGRALDTALELPVVEDPDVIAADESPQQRLRRWAMVIDLRYCDGCQSVGLPPQCTQACIQGHFVPQPMEWIEVFEDSLATAEGGTFFQPTPCQQCQNPPCTNVCPVGATFATPEGVVMIDQDRCIGCRICMAACPYDRRFFNWGEPPVPVESALADYSPEHQVPARTGTVMKCDFCPDMARAGRLPFCAQACPNDAIYYGDLETGLATNGASVVDIYEFLERNNATRLKEDLGTEPRVHYIPGHGELVGRSPLDGGRLATTWPWQERAEAASWQR
jgi:molybdopterin-containing oxidoreductase family iron-sulfur binding subunit